MTVEANERDEPGHEAITTPPVDDKVLPGSGAPLRLGGWVAVTAMAAGLVLGVLLAASIGIGSDIHSGDGFLVAQGDLARTLTNEISGAGVVGPSFWSREGEFCRVFATGGGQIGVLSGIACREKGNWRIRIVTVNSTRGELPAAVRNTMQNLIVGTPLTAAAERQARRQGWRAG